MKWQGNISKVVATGMHPAERQNFHWNKHSKNSWKYFPNTKNNFRNETEGSDLLGRSFDGGVVLQTKYEDNTPGIHVYHHHSRRRKHRETRRDHPRRHGDRRPERLGL